MEGSFVVNQMVLSSEIEWIGYEHKNRMLQVEFIEGQTYQYQNVPETVYEEFLGADSHCGYFDLQIKGRYAYRRIR